MRTLHVLLLLILSYCWQPAQAFAIVQTAQTTLTTKQQTATTATVKPNRIQQKFQKWSKQQRGSGFFDMSGNMKWLWWGIGFLILAWLAGKVVAIAATVLWIVAVICLVMWVLKTFNIM
jgi:hypothetical protein